MVIDGKTLESLEAFYKQLGAELPLPEEFGYNLDALWDFFCEYQQAFSIEVKNYDQIRDKWGFLGQSFLELLGEISDENPEIKVIFSES